ncbi:MAG: hypothetical protein ACT4NJ_03555 [Nitrosopumilaceae archaeon]
MSREVKIVWKCEICGSEIKTKRGIFNVVYTDNPNRAFCPLCGSGSLIKIEEIFEVP